MFLIQLYSGHSSRQICHNPLEQAVMNGQTDKQLELVVFA